MLRAARQFLTFSSTAGGEPGRLRSLFFLRHPCRSAVIGAALDADEKLATAHDQSVPVVQLDPLQVSWDCLPGRGSLFALADSPAIDEGAVEAPEVAHPHGRRVNVE